MLSENWRAADAKSPATTIVLRLLFRPDRHKTFFSVPGQARGTELVVADLLLAKHSVQHPLAAISDHHQTKISGQAESEPRTIGQTFAISLTDG